MLSVNLVMIYKGGIYHEKETNCTRYGRYDRIAYPNFRGGCLLLTYRQISLL